MMKFFVANLVVVILVSCKTGNSTGNLSSQSEEESKVIVHSIIGNSTTSNVKIFSNQVLKIVNKNSFRVDLFSLDFIKMPASRVEDGRSLFLMPLFRDPMKNYLDRLPADEREFYILEDHRKYSKQEQKILRAVLKDDFKIQPEEGDLVQLLLIKKPEKNRLKSGESIRFTIRDAIHPKFQLKVELRAKADSDEAIKERELSLKDRTAEIISLVVGGEALNVPKVFSRRTYTDVAPATKKLAYNIFSDQLKGWVRAESLKPGVPGGYITKVVDLETTPSGKYRVLVSGKNSSLVLAFTKEGQNWLIDRLGKTPYLGVRTGK